MEEFGLGWALGGIALTALVTTVGTWFVTRYEDALLLTERTEI